MPARPLFDLRPDPVAARESGGRTLSCVSCGLYRGVISPRMQPYGEGLRRAAIVGEGPGGEEDEKGRPWQGRAGRTLRAALRDEGFDLDRDFVSLNATNCRPVENGRNRPPTPFEVACCRIKIVDPTIRNYAPRLILLMGGHAVSSILGSLCLDALGDAIGRWRGFRIPVPSLGAWVCPTYHPSFVMREEKYPEVDTVWRLDIRRALELLDEPVPPPEDARARIEVLRSEREVMRAIYRAHDAEFLSFDYETEGLRPQFHGVICASFAVSADRACAFMMPRDGPIPGAWSKLMANPNVGKIAHNMKFENEWTRTHYGVEEINWSWDSMVGAHVVDNRVGICGLKLQVFLNFGEPDWSVEIEPYLKAVDANDPTSPNRIWEFIERFGEDEALVYCGIDSLMSYRLAMRQMEVIGGGPH